MVAFIFASLPWGNPRNYGQSFALLHLNSLSTNRMQSEGGWGFIEMKHMLWQAHLCQLYETKVPNMIILAFCSTRRCWGGGFVNAAGGVCKPRFIWLLPLLCCRFSLALQASLPPRFPPFTQPFSPDKSEVEPPSNFPRFWAQRLN